MGRPDSIPAGEVVSDRLRVGIRVRASRGSEMEEDGSSLQSKLLGSHMISKGSSPGPLQRWRGVRGVLRKHTDKNVSLPSLKSRVPNSMRDSAFLSPLVQLFVRVSHSGWKPWHSSQP